MPTNTIKFTPGINVEFTPTLNLGAYQSCNRIRFAPSGLPEKLGGWVKFYPDPITSSITAMYAWEDLEGVAHLAVGATGQLSVITSGTLLDITPQTTTTDNVPNMSTVAGSPTVTVFDAGSNATIYDVVIFETQISVGQIVLSGAYQVAQALSSDQYEITAASNAGTTANNTGSTPRFTTAVGLSTVTVALAFNGYSVGSTFSVGVPVNVGGLTLSGFYTVTAIIDSHDFQITATTVATSTATAPMDGPNARLIYYVAPGPNTRGQGYGDGGYGMGGYGLGVTPPIATGTPITAVDWTLDNFGGALVASPANGPIFTWQSQSGLYVAQMIANAPTINTGVFVSYAAEIILAYGSSVLGVQDPLLINWCSSGNYSNWAPTVANSAGSYRIPRGSKIIGGLQGPLFDIFWTDLEVWAATYIGQPNIYGFSSLAVGCGLASKFAAGVLLNTVYWLSYAPPTTPGAAVGSGQFYALPSGGSVTPFPCTVWDFIFDQIDITHVDKIRCAVNSVYGEVAWHFPTKISNGVNAAYVKFTPQFNAWDFGDLGRSAWIDQSVYGPPIGSESTLNYIYQHETATDADDSAMGESFVTGFWALSEGQDQMFCDQMYPDFKFGKIGGAQVSQVEVQFTYTDYPTGAPQYQTPIYTMTVNGPGYINPRFRARLAQMTVGVSNYGSWWRLGGLRSRTAADGRL